MKYRVAIDPAVMRNINNHWHLSDYLFVAARFANRVQGVDDVPWRPVEC